jgi:hypothetical protein
MMGMKLEWIRNASQIETEDFIQMRTLLELKETAKIMINSDLCLSR